MYQHAQKSRVCNTTEPKREPLSLQYYTRDILNISGFLVAFQQRKDITRMMYTVCDKRQLINAKRMCSDRPFHTHFNPSSGREKNDSLSSM